ncbi:hypothetical protein GCM10012288_00280 [Malaciobacter pacificus]|uniref:Uncharacterized protein n=2 Tax=Malaciobacter pacificus TaxID=1080223 RepID=A0A5C2H2V1_9BACT|nr:hypothetical protein [Malaciobacter pacificus]QEP33287.1 hypothetical protein APAC_0117 [Malaciobacter pacificus]GGD30201.1 hypothetical protein GCM10012288_00280 [Malaciobacter pacificus]
MRKVLSITFIVSLIILFSGCSPKSYHNEMLDNTKRSLGKKDYQDIKTSYTEELVNEVKKQKEYISILEDKSLGDILKEMELLDGNFYFLKSSDILIPKSRIKIHSMSELNHYLNAVLDKELFVKKSGSIYLVKLLNVSESKKLSLDRIPFKLNGQISVEELIKLITASCGYEVSIGNYIKDRFGFQNSIVNISSTNLKDALNSLAYAKNVYVDIDYDKEMINISRYKDMVVELNIPLLDIKSTNETSSQETSGESSIKNSSQIVLYDELDKMLKNIIATDSISTYHIDKASGLIFLKSTRSVENAVRTIVKAYETSFAKEATIEFERIELALNKSREYGIGSISDSRQTNQDAGVLKSIGADGAINFTSDNATRLLQIAAKANNEIGTILNYSKNIIVLKNNIPSVQSISQNTDYIEKIETTVTEGVSTSEATVNTIKDGTSVTAMAKISRDKIFLNITPTIKKLIEITEKTVGDSTIQLPQYNDQSYNISREVKLGETAIVGSIIIHDDAKEYQGILPLEGFAIGGADSKSYVRREIVYIVTLRNIKGF